MDCSCRFLTLAEIRQNPQGFVKTPLYPWPNRLQHGTPWHLFLTALQKNLTYLFTTVSHLSMNSLDSKTKHRKFFFCVICKTPNAKYHRTLVALKLWKLGDYRCAVCRNNIRRHLFRWQQQFIIRHRTATHTLPNLIYKFQWTHLPFIAHLIAMTYAACGTYSIPFHLFSTCIWPAIF